MARRCAPFQREASPGATRDFAGRTLGAAEYCAASAGSLRNRKLCAGTGSRAAATAGEARKSLGLRLSKARISRAARTGKASPARTETASACSAMMVMNSMVVPISA